jgi:oxaloacetate decarboxylase alpha subunit
MPGTIATVNVSVGETVERGDVLVTIEAMKMETEIRAFKAGTVASVNVKVGDAVSVGDSLLSIA